MQNHDKSNQEGQLIQSGREKPNPRSRPTNQKHPIIKPKHHTYRPPNHKTRTPQSKTNPIRNTSKHMPRKTKTQNPNRTVTTTRRNSPFPTQSQNTNASTTKCQTKRPPNQRPPQRSAKSSKRKQKQPLPKIKTRPKNSLKRIPSTLQINPRNNPIENTATKPKNPKNPQHKRTAKPRKEGSIKRRQPNHASGLTTNSPKRTPVFPDQQPQ
ncbi:hypothetical protein LV83_03247 [Algoriphagus yeomjeoni]|uniref:Uncharacterized protein n=1 Tax=Algoriphagus yeomjeoni TaxID=291403 RepID=A0A327P548_9BACT|nr:hypothetical protein LV83_03247 [Algoriphagus yeomjeoni]